MSYRLHRLNLDNEVEATEKEYTRPVHHIQFLKPGWFRYAAAILVILISVTYLWNIQPSIPPDQVVASNLDPVKNDVAPGGNRAILTLADGREIVLDSAADGQVAQEGAAEIEKVSAGRVRYSVKTEGSFMPVMTNTLTTPPGGQYQLTLPDGTHAWLNANSSITYPTFFDGNDRRVAIRGEVYFEVAKMNKRFIVDIDNKALVEVLGTSFNINAYSDEATINTTLMEGSVIIKSAHRFITLKPQQQGQLNTKTEALSITDYQDLAQIIAWKNGLFHFENADLKTILRHFVRWYNIEVIYEGPVSDELFFMMMNRNVPLSRVLKSLNTSDIKFKIEGRKLYVQSN